MDDTRFWRLGSLSGVVFVILLVTGALMVNSFDYLPAPEAIRNFYEDSTTRLQAGANIIMVSAFFLMWFGGSLRGTLRSAEGGIGRLSAVAFGGAIGAGALLVFGYATTSAAAARAGTESGIAVGSATALHDLGSVVTGEGLPIPLAVMVGAAAVVGFRSRLFPTWFSWVSGVVAGGLLSPVGYVFLVLAVAWIAVVSTFLYVRHDRA